MSPEFFSRWKFHQRAGIIALAVMQAFISCVLIKFNIFSIRGIVLAIYIAVYMAFIVAFKLSDLYSRNIPSLIRIDSILAAVVCMVMAIVLFFAEGASALIYAIFECVLTIAVYVLWMRLMKLWLKRQFCPREYVCVGDDDGNASELLELKRLDSSIFSTGKFFRSEDNQDITDYMKMFRIGIMVISKVSQDTYKNMLEICHKFNAMAFLTEKPGLQEYESSIREVHVGGRTLWLYLPQN